MVMSIYELATALQDQYNQYNQYYLEPFKTWIKPLLEHFDAIEVGTAAQLSERRDQYINTLKEDHKAYVDAMRHYQEKTMTHFREALAQEFFSYPPDGITISTKVSDSVFGRAYDSGHSGGFHDVVTEYGELAEFVLLILRDAREEKT